MKLIKKTPLAVSGLSLALAALGNLLLPYGDIARYICGILSAVVLCIFILKLICDFDNAKEDLENPVVLSVLPTATMSLMLLSVYVKAFIGFAAVIIWIAAIVAHIFIMVLFIKRFVVGFKLQTVFPSWFIAAVGLVVASVTSKAMDAKPFGQAVFYIGFALYFVTLAVVVYRMIKVKPIPEPARPTIAIFTAPMSLCLAGYLSAFDQPNAALVYLMLAIAVISYVYVTFCMVFLLRLKFYPTYAAFTFPYVISAIAFKGANELLMKNGIGFFSFVPKLTEWIAIIVVAYVTVRYVMFMMAKEKV